MKQIHFLKAFSAALVALLLILALAACANEGSDSSETTGEIVTSGTVSGEPTGTPEELTTAAPETEIPGAEEDTRFGDLHVRPISTETQQ